MSCRQSHCSTVREGGSLVSNASQTVRRVCRRDFGDGEWREERAGPVDGSELEHIAMGRDGNQFKG